MFRRLVSVIFVIFFVTTICGTVSAADKAVKKAVSVKQLSADQMKAVEDNVRAALKEKEWIIYITDRDGGKGVETDSLLFTDETVDSKNLAAGGYGVSNFGLFVQPNGSASWETMKTNPANKNKAFLRGEIRGGVMTGTIFMKPQKGRTSTFIFSTVSPAAAPAAVATTTTKKSGK